MRLLKSFMVYKDIEDFKSISKKTPCRLECSRRFIGVCGIKKKLQRAHEIAEYFKRL